MLNKDLDKLIDEFMDANNNEVSINETASYFYGLGKQAMKEQIMKNTIDIKVIESYNPTCEPNERLHGISFIYDCKNDNQYLIAGDRAKIIIVKEEE